MNKNLLFPLALLLISAGSFAQKPGSYYGIEFDGVDDHVLIPDISALNPTTKLTVEAWIKADAWGASSFTNSIVCKHGWATGNKGYVLRCGDNGKLSFNISNSSGTWVETISGSVMKTGVWYHVAGTFNGDSIKVYINGNLEAFTLYSGTISVSTGLSPKIGDLSYTVGGSRPFKGQIDEVRIWGAALSRAEIREWMCRKVKSSHPQYSALAGYYKLDEATGTSTQDYSSNANTATLVNGPRWVVSGAALGDTSKYTYGGSSVALPTKFGDVFEVRNFVGGPSYVHSYVNYQTSGQVPALNVLGAIDSSHYFGVFYDDNKSVNFDINYNFKNLTKVQGVKKCGVNMLTKTAGYTGTWGYAGGKLYSSDDSLAVYNQGKNEFVMALYETDSNKLISTGLFSPWLCENDSIMLSAAGNDSFQYSWYKDGNVLGGKTKRTLWVSAVGTYKLKMQRKGTTCSFLSSNFVLVDKRPTVTWSYAFQTCENSDSVKLPEGSPSGGTFSGKRVTANGYFHPKLAGARKHNLQYIVTDKNGCTNRASGTITLLDTTKLTVSGLTPLCFGANPQVLLYVFPGGGTYQGTGMSSNVFYPQTAGPGRHDLTYTYTTANKCQSKVHFEQEVFKPDSINITLPPSACTNAEPVQIQLYPGGKGVVISPAVVGSTFYPAFAPLGWNKVIYKMDDSNNCTVWDTASIYVAEKPSVSILPFSSTCDNTPAFTLGGGSPADSGKYWVEGTMSSVFDPVSQGRGVFKIEYRVVNYFGCRDSASTNLRVNPSPSKPGITVSTNDLISSSATGNQWMNKDGAIAGATAQTYTPTKDGFYFVKVTNDSNCSAVSDSVEFKKTIGVREDKAAMVSVYPNPSHSGVFYIKGLKETSAVEVYDPLGRRLITFFESGPEHPIDLSSCGKGNFVLSFQVNGRKINTRVTVL